MLSTLTLFCFSDSDILAAVQSDQLEILKLFLKTRVVKNPVIYELHGSKLTVMMVASQFSYNITNFYIANYGK